MNEPTTEILLDLYRLVDRLSATKGFQPALDEVLSASIHLLDADMGHIRLRRGRGGLFTFAAHQGFPQEYLDYFANLSPAAIAAGPAVRSLEQNELVIVPDVRTHPPFAPHLEIIDKAGYVSMLARPIVDRNGVVIGSFSAHFKRHELPGKEQLDALGLYMRLAADVIERAEREEALAESETRYRALTDLSPEAILVNQDLRWVYANQTAARMLGAGSAEELLGRSPLEFIAEEFHETALSRMQRLIKEGTANPPLEQRWRRLDGSYFDCEVTSAAITWEGAPAILLVCRDITERKQAEEAMRAATQLKDEFLGLVSHELRTPLTTIKGYAALLSRRPNLAPETIQEGLRDLASESERLNRIVENMLVLARMEAGQKVPVEPVPLRPAIESAVEHFRQVQIDAEVVVEPLPDVTVLAVPQYLEQVLQNLLSNAHKYSPKDAPITISAAREGGYVRIAVADRGIGVKEVDQVFDAFVREDSAALVAQGLGIGLTVCKRLVEIQGGEINAAAREGGGSVFSFTLAAVNGVSVDDAG